MARIKIDIPDNRLAEIIISVRISDINYGNHVSNDAFVSIIHEARLQWLSQHGFSEINIAGTGLIMADLVFEFKNESFYGDQLTIQLSAGDMSRVGFDLYYEVFTTRNEKALLIAKAKTGMVCFNYELKKVAAMPDVLKSLLSKN